MEKHNWISLGMLKHLPWGESLVFIESIDSTFFLYVATLKNLQIFKIWNV